MLQVLLLSAFLLDGAVSLKVIGAGFGRTGTQSLKLALNRLGFGPTYHMDELLFGEHRSMSVLEMIGFGPGHNEKWVEVSQNLTQSSRSTQLDWTWLEQDYNSAVDAPASSYWVELLQANPEAKIILTIRDPITWHESIRAAFCKLNPGAGMSYLDEIVAFITTTLRPYGRRQRRMYRAIDDGIRRTLGRGWENYSIQRTCRDREYASRFFEAWNQKVIKDVPKEQLLVFETGKHGWTELAGFLNVTVPLGEDYPRRNSNKDFGLIIIIVRVLALLTVAVPTLIIWWVASRHKKSNLDDRQKIE